VVLSRIAHFTLEHNNDDMAVILLVAMDLLTTMSPEFVMENAGWF
jgi:hypothetical protein